MTDFANKRKNEAVTGERKLYGEISYLKTFGVWRKTNLYVHFVA